MARIGRWMFTLGAFVMLAGIVAPAQAQLVVIGHRHHHRHHHHHHRY